MKHIGNGAHFLHTSFQRFGALGQKRAMCLVDARGLPLYHLDIDFDAGEILSQAIVQFAADTAALIILDADQTRSESADAFFGAFQIGDVVHHADEFRAPAVLFGDFRGSVEPEGLAMHAVHAELKISPFPLAHDLLANGSDAFAVLWGNMLFPEIYLAGPTFQPITQDGLSLRADVSELKRFRVRPPEDRSHEFAGLRQLALRQHAGAASGDQGMCIFERDAHSGGAHRKGRHRKQPLTSGSRALGLYHSHYPGPPSQQDIPVYLRQVYKCVQL